jgi:hypothetical protein
VGGSAVKGGPPNSFIRRLVMIKVLYAMTAVLVLVGGASAAEHRERAGMTSYGDGYIRGHEVDGNGRFSDRTPTCYRAEYLAQRNVSGACF